MKSVCLDSSESKSYNLTDEGGEINFKGWNIKNPEKLIKEEIEDEYFEEYEVTDLKIISKEEMAYSASRYFEGQDAKEEGYGYWIDYHKDWKKGLGKATCFKISYKLSEVS